MYAQALKLSFVIELEEDHLTKVINNYVENMKNSNQPIVENPLKRLQKYQINVMKEQRGYPLDYIVNIPQDILTKFY